MSMDRARSDAAAPAAVVWAARYVLASGCPVPRLAPETPRPFHHGRRRPPRARVVTPAHTRVPRTQRTRLPLARGVLTILVRHLATPRRTTATAPVASRRHARVRARPCPRAAAATARRLDLVYSFWTPPCLLPPLRPQGRIPRAPALTVLTPTVHGHTAPHSHHRMRPVFATFSLFPPCRPHARFTQNSPD